MELRESSLPSRLTLLLRLSWKLRLPLFSYNSSAPTTLLSITQDLLYGGTSSSPTQIPRSLTLDAPLALKKQSHTEVCSSIHATNVSSLLMSASFSRNGGFFAAFPCGQTSGALQLFSPRLGDSSQDPGPSREGVNPVLCSDTNMEDSDAEHTDK